jgi:RNA polymerase sigma-70 factor (ECF subfamily)
MADASTNPAFEAALLRAAASGKHPKPRLEDEVAELFERWRPGLLRYLLAVGLPTPDAEEVVQEVFLSLYSHLQKGKPRTNLPGWLFRVAHNLGLKRRHIASKSVALAEDLESLPHAALNPEEQLAHNQRRQRLLSILQALPEQDRRCLYLRAEGLRYREIAEILGMSLGAVAISLDRSLEKFQRGGQR